MTTILKFPRAVMKRLIPAKVPSLDLGTSGKRKDNKFNFRKFAFNWSGYNKFGLYSDDIIDYEDLVIKEALRRLPKEVLDARNFRIIRAMQLDLLMIYLPKEKWITYEQDQEYRYLRPYVQEIVAERMEIYEFGCNNYGKNDWPQQELK